ncbi:hypothetical protein T484DRAFT_3116871 [Baffinella frigidus]|nr:hypothetical protein T484DRAFT_3116871 [Cryptophyta sp. CCMP2293]
MLHSVNQFASSVNVHPGMAHGRAPVSPAHAEIHGQTDGQISSGEPPPPVAFGGSILVYPEP